MPRFTVRTLKDAPTELSPLTESLTKLLTNVYECADDGGSEGTTISRITVRRNDAGGWLLVAGWTVASDSDVPAATGTGNTSAYVSFHGGNELCAAVAALEEALADGEVVLIPDKFNGHKAPPKRRK